MHRRSARFSRGPLFAPGTRGRQTGRAYRRHSRLHPSSSARPVGNARLPSTRRRLSAFAPSSTESGFEKHGRRASTSALVPSHLEDETARKGRKARVIYAPAREGPSCKSACTRGGEAPVYRRHNGIAKRSSRSRWQRAFSVTSARWPRQAAFLGQVTKTRGERCL